MTNVTVYSLTQEELETITTLNNSRTNVLLIACSYPGDIVGVILEDLESPIYDDYLQALGGTIDPTKVVEVEIEGLF